MYLVNAGTTDLVKELTYNMEANFLTKILDTSASKYHMKQRNVFSKKARRLRFSKAVRSVRGEKRHTLR